MYKQTVVAVILTMVPLMAFAVDTKPDSDNISIASQVYNDDQNELVQTKLEEPSLRDTDVGGGLYVNNNTYKKYDTRSVQGYIGAGLVGQSIKEKTRANGTEIADVDTGGFGINLNGGIKTRYLRFGVDISSTVGNAEISSRYYDYYDDYDETFDINVVKYSIELAGIIRCGEQLDLEIGGTIGRARAQVEGTWGNWITPYGLLFGLAINFNKHHALSIALKGYKYKSTDYIYKSDGTIGEFVVGYRYSF